MKALILVDIQNDFLPGGSLEVLNGDQVIDIVNELTKRFDGLIIATQDWHPAETNYEEDIWPVHCVQETKGSELAEKLNCDNIDAIFRKGSDPEFHSYGAFFDNPQKESTGLDEYLQNNEVTEVYVMGLATDFCVKETVLEALRLNYKTYFVLNGCRGIYEDKIDEAVKEMEAAGAELTLTGWIK